MRVGAEALMGAKLQHFLLGSVAMVLFGLMLNIVRRKIHFSALVKIVRPVDVPKGLQVFPEVGEYALKTSAFLLLCLLHFGLQFRCPHLGFSVLDLVVAHTLVYCLRWSDTGRKTRQWPCRFSLPLPSASSPGSEPST